MFGECQWAQRAPAGSGLLDAGHRVRWLKGWAVASGRGDAGF